MSSNANPKVHVLVAVSIQVNDPLASVDSEKHQLFGCSDEWNSSAYRIPKQFELLAELGESKAIRYVPAGKLTSPFVGR